MKDKKKKDENIEVRQNVENEQNVEIHIEGNKPENKGENQFFKFNFKIEFLLSIILIIVFSSLLGFDVIKIGDLSLSKTVSNKNNNQSVSSCEKNIIELKDLIDNSLTFQILPKQYEYISNNKLAEQKKIDEIIIQLNIVRFSELVQLEIDCRNKKILTNDFTVLKQDIIKLINSTK